MKFWIKAEGGRKEKVENLSEKYVNFDVKSGGIIHSSEMNVRVYYGKEDAKQRYFLWYCEKLLRFPALKMVEINLGWNSCFALCSPNGIAVFSASLSLVFPRRNG